MIGVYVGLLKSQMQLAFRERIVIFFNYVFPLIFFFMFGELMDARKGTGSAQYLLSTVLSIGILGNGLFGIGMRAVQDRQQGILKRLHLGCTACRCRQTWVRCFSSYPLPALRFVGLD